MAQVYTQECLRCDNKNKHLIQDTKCTQYISSSVASKSIKFCNVGRFCGMSYFIHCIV